MNHRDSEAPFHLAGWVLFLICAFLFLYSAVREGDRVLILASLVFLGGCVVFLVPILFPKAAGRGACSSDRDRSSEERG